MRTLSSPPLNIFCLRPLNLNMQCLIITQILRCIFKAYLRIFVYTIHSNNIWNLTMHVAYSLVCSSDMFFSNRHDLFYFFSNRHDLVFSNGHDLFFFLTVMICFIFFLTDRICFFLTVMICFFSNFYSDRKKNQFNSKQTIQILQSIIIDNFSTHSYIVDIS